MNINVPNTHDLVRFHDLKPGDVFNYNGVCYMKIKYVIDSNHRSYDAISLVGGIPMGFSDNVYVDPIDGEFVVKKVEA